MPRWTGFPSLVGFTWVARALLVVLVFRDPTGVEVLVLLLANSVISICIQMTF